MKRVRFRRYIAAFLTIMILIANFGSVIAIAEDNVIHTEAETEYDTEEVNMTEEKQEEPESDSAQPEKIGMEETEEIENQEEVLEETEEREEGETVEVVESETSPEKSETEEEDTIVIENAETEEEDSSVSEETETDQTISEESETEGLEQATLEETETETMDQNTPKKMSRAADVINAVLYEDGTLVFQKAASEFEKEHGKIVERFDYDENNPVWNNSDAIIRIDFQTTIQPVSINYWFQDCTSLTDVSNLRKLDTSKLQEAKGLFKNCTGLQEFTFDGSGMQQMENLSDMFYNCTALTTVTFKNVTVRQNPLFAVGMFSGCAALTKVDLSGWKICLSNTGKIQLQGTFQGCGNLRQLYLRRWYLPDSYSIENLLGGSRGIAGLNNINLALLDVSEWNLPQCKSMKDAFSYISAERINVTGMQIPCVTDLSGLFQMNRKLTQVDGFENLSFSSELLNVSDLFYVCESLESITLDGINVAKAERFAMWCGKLKYVKLSGWHIKDISDINLMFAFCNSLTSVNIPEWEVDGNNLDAIGNKFGLHVSCPNLELLNMKNWKIKADGITVEGAFKSLEVKYVLLSGWNTEKMISMKEMFAKCKNLEVVDLTSWNTAAVIDYARMFLECSSLKELDIHSFQMSGAKDIQYMLAGCTGLERLDISSWEISEDTNTYNTFAGLNACRRIDLSGNTMTDAQYRAAYVRGLSALKEVIVDDISGAPLFLADFQSSWYDNKNREYVIGNAEISKKLTLYREKNGESESEEMPGEVPDKQEKQIYHVEISVNTLLDGKEIFKAPYNLSIYDEDHNWICTGTSDKLFAGAFEEGKSYLIEIQQRNQPNYFVETTGDSFVFQTDMQHQDIVITYRSRANVTVSKTWNDDEDAGGNRPDKLAVTLYKNGDPIDTQYLSEENGWKYTWSDLYRYDESENGNVENKWEVQETVPPGYTEEYVHVQTEKDRAADFVNAEIVKTWHDYSNAKNLRIPITFRLLRDTKPNMLNAVEIDNRTYEWLDGNYYKTGWYNLPAYDEEGNNYYYKVTEDPIPFYTSKTYRSGNGVSFDNTYSDTDTVTVVKKWSENPDGITRLNGELECYVGEKKHNSAISFLLSGEETDLNAENGWKTTVTVPKYTESGEKITGYKVVEYEKSFVSSKKIEGKYQPYYMNRGKEYVIYNQYIPPHQEPETYPNEPETEPETEKGEEGNVTVTPKAGFFSIHKKWNDGDNFDEIRPDSVEIEFYQNNVLYGTYTLSEENGWMMEIGELPIRDDTGVYSYSFKEKNIPEGYTCKVTSTIREEERGSCYEYFATNTHVPSPDPDYEIRKIWNDRGDENGYRPESIEVELYANNTLLDTYVLSEENEWKQMLGVLPQTDDNGRKILYTVKEKEIPVHYLASYEYSSSKHDSYYTTQYLDIVNTEVSKMADIDWGIINTPKSVDIGVKKIWDVSETYNLSDEKVLVQLFMQVVSADHKEDGVYSDAQPVGEPVELHMGNAWTYTWKSKIEFKNGYPVKYSVNEVDANGTVITPNGFIKNVSANADDEGYYTITNTSTKVEVQKTDQDGNLIGGTHLQILQGKEVLVEWDTVKGEKKLLEGILQPDVTYILHESKAPGGYALADDISFSVRSDGISQMISMEDTRLVKLPQTGGKGTGTPWQIPFVCMIMMMALSSAIKMREAK